MAEMAEMARSVRFRRAGRAVGALAVVGALGLGSACGSNAQEGATTVEVGDQHISPADALVRASDTTSAVETGRMEVTYVLSGTADGEPFRGSMRAEGSFADFGREAEITLDMTSLLSTMGGISGDRGEDVPDSLVVNEIVADGAVYLRMDVDPPEQGLGFDGWIKMDLSELMAGQSSGMGGMLGGLGGAGGLSSGPSSYLESLKGAGAAVEEAGEDEIDGAHVTVYRGTIDPEAAVAAAAPDQADESSRAFAMPASPRRCRSPRGWTTTGWCAGCRWGSSSTSPATRSGWTWTSSSTTSAPPSPSRHRRRAR